MAMFTFYADASGHPKGTPVLFVSGFVSSTEKWLKFETEWAQLLRGYGIRPPFHMKKFAPGAGQYASWRDDHVRRRAFLTEAIRIIKHRTHKSFSAGIVVGDLAEVCRLYRVPKSHSYPLPVCGTHIVKQVSKWVVRGLKKGSLSSSDGLTLIFEDGDTHKGILSEELDKLNVSYAYRTKEQAMPLQAADFLAWEHARVARTRLSRLWWPKDLWRPRGSLVALTKHIPNDGSWSIIDKKGMLTGCEKAGWPRRTANGGT